MKQSAVWGDAVERAIERGFNISDWLLRVDPKEHERVIQYQKFLQGSFKEAFIDQLTVMSMKALAFSHDFALCFFPKEKCEDPECSVCKDEGGHEKYVTHMKNMCEYADFTTYLETVIDEDE